MYTLLLMLIYLAFISLGLPDALLGSAWPSMYPLLNVPVGYAGIIAMIIAGGTIVSSLNTSRLVNRLGTGLVTALSVLLTALALFGFAFSSTFWMLCLLAIPYGLGAGAVDAALNHFVATHYGARHMNWLHSFWGVGAAIGPYVMAYHLVRPMGWSGGYHTIGIFQVGLFSVLFLSLPLWKKQAAHVAKSGGGGPVKHLKLVEAFKIPGVKPILTAFFAYCALETTAGLWASSYLVLHRGIDVESAARWASLFYLGITGGRFLSGFVAERVGNRGMIRIGLLVLSGGLLLVVLPFGTHWVSLVGLVLIGFGCAPIYPSIIHETPTSFGKEHAGAIIGIQMASAYTGSTLMPPLFGFIATQINIGLYPIYLSLFLIIMVVMTERLNRVVAAVEARKNGSYTWMDQDQ